MKRDAEKASFILTNMKRKRKKGQRTYEYIQREVFDVGNTSLIIEDRINTILPCSSERMLWIAGTDAYYSIVPICPAWHSLLCFTYCEDIMKCHDAAFYRNVLVLGCGGGAVPKWILQEYPSLTVDVVDRSPEIIDICKKYFIREWADSSRLKIICQDAQDYEPPEYQYQFIFCDLFDGEFLAPVVCSRSFAQKLREMISDEGVLVINCGWHDTDEIIKIYQVFFEHLQFVRREPGQTKVLMASSADFPE